MVRQATPKRGKAKPCPRIALYVRVSTSGQDAAGQLRELRAYARRRDAEVLEFVDHGISGRQDRRPGLDALLEAVRRREVEAVVCTELSRLARSARHLCDLAAELQAAGVALVVLRQSIDTGSPSGRLLFHTLASVAEFEADLVRERTIAGLDAARARGVVLGRPQVLDARTRQRARRLRKGGKSIRTIACTLGISTGSAFAAIQSEPSATPAGASRGRRRRSA